MGAWAKAAAWLGAELDQEHAKPMMKKGLLVLLALEVVALAVSAALGDPPWRVGLTLASWLLVSGAGWTLAQMGRYEAGLNAMSIMGAIAMALFARSSGGLASPALVMPFFMSSMAAAVGSRRGVAVSVLASSVSMGVIWWMDTGGHLAQLSVSAAPGCRVGFIAIYFAMCSALGALSVGLAARLQKEGRERREDFEDLFRTAPVAMIALSKAEGGWTVAQANLAMGEMLGRPAKELVGMEISKGLSGALSEHVAMDLSAKLDSGELCVEEMELVGNAGALIRSRLVARSGRLGGQPAWFLAFQDETAQFLARDALSKSRQELEGMVRDRTGQLLMAQVEIDRRQRMVSMGAMVAGLAHEMNTPIGNALLTASALRERSEGLIRKAEGGAQATNAEMAKFGRLAKEGAQVVEVSMERARDLISRCRLMSTERESLRLRDFDLYDCVQGAVEQARLAIDPKRVQIELIGSPGVRMKSYSGEIAHIVASLMQNAVDHGIGGGEGCVTVEVIDRGVGKAALRVSDDGRGFTDQAKARAFEAFYTTERTKGSVGLGLAICSELARGVLGGKLAIEQGGGGASLLLEIPKSAPSKEAESHRP